MQLLLGVGGEGSSISLTQYIQSLSGLVAYYPLNETSGNAINQAPDTIGTLDGTLTGATQNVAGQSGTAYSFDGVNDRVTVSTSASLDQLTGTWGFLLKLSANKSGNGNTIMSRNDGGSSASGINIKLDTNNVVTVQLKSGTTSRLDLGAVTQLDTTSWYSVIFTYTNNGICKFYINGVETASGTMSGTFTFNSQSLLFGENADGFWADFNGLLQHGVVFSRAIDATEALTIAQLAGLA